MRTAVVTLILLACALAFVVAVKTPPRTPLLVDAAVRDPEATPAGKLFALCPVNRTNVPTLIERSA